MHRPPWKTTFRRSFCITPKSDARNAWLCHEARNRRESLSNRGLTAHGKVSARVVGETRAPRRVRPGSGRKKGCQSLELAAEKITLWLWNSWFADFGFTGLNWI